MIITVRIDQYLYMRIKHVKEFDNKEILIIWLKKGEIKESKDFKDPLHPEEYRDRYTMKCKE